MQNCSTGGGEVATRFNNNEFHITLEKALDFIAPRFYCLEFLFRKARAISGNFDNSAEYFSHNL
jgi:hypothetical protein